jgi:hypothetical protein
MFYMLLQCASALSACAYEYGGLKYRNAIIFNLIISGNIVHNELIFVSFFFDASDPYVFNTNRDIMVT